MLLIYHSHESAINMATKSTHADTCNNAKDKANQAFH